MEDIIKTILSIGGTILGFYLIAKFGAWYEDRQGRKQMGGKRIKIERWLDRYNHIMEFIRTILALTTIGLQLYIISKLTGGQYEK